MEIKRQLEYEADWYRREVVKINIWFSSSQICFICETHHERYINAVINILNEGLRMRKAGIVGIA